MRTKLPMQPTRAKPDECNVPGAMLTPAENRAGPGAASTGRREHARVGAHPRMLTRAGRLHPRASATHGSREHGTPVSFLPTPGSELKATTRILPSQYAHRR